MRQWVVSAMRDAGRTESTETAADAFLDEICRRSGLLLPRGEDQFAFTHLSFQEFFAAVFFVPQFVRPPRRAESKGMQGAGRDDLHAYVENRMWHETLVFLVELMFAEHPDWLEELLFCLFGEGFSEVAPRPSMKAVQGQQEPAKDPKLDQAILLARLAIDPHTGLAERSLKSDAITRCCAFEAGEQKRMEEKTRSNILQAPDPYEPDVLRVLLGAHQNELSQVWMAIADAMREAAVVAFCLNRAPLPTATPLAGLSNLRALDLTQTAVVDLSPMSGFTALEMFRVAVTQVTEVGPVAVLTKLTHLCLASTRVSDIGPLAALTGIQGLNLHRTRVTDVRPLAALTGLRWLRISQTQVSDVSPLSALTGLQSLDLSSTQVSDVGPLAALTGLQSLDLSGTKVSDDDVRKLRKALPKCRIHR